MLVMTRGPNSCIYAFPPAIWDYYMDQMLDLDMADEDRLELMRAVLSPATNCMIDSQWRVKLPEELTQHAELDREVEIVGLIDRLEIWNPEARIKYQEQRKADYTKTSMPLFIGKMPPSKWRRDEPGPGEGSVP